jgi:tetratricopeptide (TPR) repeat protein
LIGVVLAQQSPSDPSPSNPPPASQNSPNQTPNQPPPNQPPPNQSSNQASSPLPPPNQPPPGSAQEEKAEQEKSRERSAEAGESSSRDTQIDTSPPKDDAKHHPNGGAAMSDSPEDMGDVQETHPWNPYRAQKDDEVADFYFKQKDYKAALARSQDALLYKDNDAVANFRMGECYDKMGQPEKSIPYYQEYLKILPEGPYAKRARKALAKLGASDKQTSHKTSSE